MNENTNNVPEMGPNPTAGAAGPEVRFFHRAGHANVRSEIDALIDTASKSLRSAVCFFTRAGHVMLSRHASRLKLPDSYFVASVDFPTDLDAMLALHWLAPGHVYIHLGGKTPEEPRVGRSLMHSKMFLAVDGDHQGRLWVGSHNLTAMAMEGGNFEAGVMLSGPISSTVIQDAVAHLEACRTTAELFDPNDMERYREIQNRLRGKSEWEIERSVLVIQAEAAQLPKQWPFVVHVHVEPIDFDTYFRVERCVRLFLHPPGALKLGRPVDYRKASLWSGEITAVVRTERHPRNRGASGQFAAADYDVDVPSSASVPIFDVSGRSQVKAKTQAVARIDVQGEPGTEVFSVGSKSPVKNVLDVAGILELHEVDDDMRGYFTRESVEGNRLLYRPAIGVRQELSVTGYEETLHEGLAQEFASDLMPDATRRVHYQAKTPSHPIDPFVFVSNYVVRPKGQQ